jgi:general secretion pathway protein D
MNPLHPKTMRQAMQHTSFHPQTPTVQRQLLGSQTLRWQHAVWALACVTALALSTPSVLAQASRKEPVTLNFVNAEIDAVARTLATLSGANVVVDPRVKGTMSLSSTVPVPPAQALRLFAAQLRTQGFALVESAGLYTVLPEAEAKLQSSTVTAGAVPVKSGQIVTQIFQLNHENANNLVPVLRPLISPNNTINVNPGTNALVITDYGDNLQRLGRIIAALDVANATGVEVIRLQHGIAAELAPMVQRLIDSGAAAGAGAPPAQGQTDTAFRTTVLPEVRTNSLIIRAANPARLSLVRSLVVQLDQPSATGARAASGNIHVVYLKNADATKLAATLRAAVTAQGNTSLPGNTNTSLPTTPPAPSSSTLGQSNATPAGFNRWPDPSRPGHQLVDHHRARASVPPVACRHRHAGPAPGAGVCREFDCRGQRRQSRPVWGAMDEWHGHRQQHRRSFGHQLWNRQHQPAEHRRRCGRRYAGCTYWT